MHYRSENQNLLSLKCEVDNEKKKLQDELGKVNDLLNAVNLSKESEKNFYEGRLKALQDDCVNLR